MSKLINFLKEVRVEMKKVNWPSRHETLKYTIIVVISSVIVAIFLGSMDFIFSKLIFIKLIVPIII